MNVSYPKPCGIIAVLTDFGLDDPYVAAMKAVAYSVCSNVNIIDITHNVDSFDIESAALILFMVYKYFPRGTVFVVVVDPGVGSSRRPLAVATKNYIFIGPDNGVLLPAAKSDGVVEARVLENDKYFRKPVSKSFHGRDIFMPVASHLVCGADFESVGEKIDVSSLVNVNLGLWYSKVINRCIEVKVIHIDKFGNVILSIPFNDFKQLLNVDLGMDVQVHLVGKVIRARVEEVFSITPRGTLVVYENSFGLTELAVNQGSAKDILNVAKGSTLKLCVD